MNTLSTTIGVRFALRQNNISRHPRRVYSESCAFDYASITFKEADAIPCAGGVKREREGDSGAAGSKKKKGE